MTVYAATGENSTCFACRSVPTVAIAPAMHRIVRELKLGGDGENKGFYLFRDRMVGCIMLVWEGRRREDILDTRLIKI